jgi:flagellar biosynthesis/type III secretory pathway protein FliH
MSDPDSAPQGAAARPAKVRPARVWQALDLLQPQVASSKFAASPWGASPVPFFDPTDFSRLTYESPNDLAQRLSESSQAEPEAALDVEADTGLSEALAAASAEALALARSEGHAQGVAETRAALQAEMQNTLKSRLATDQSLLQSMQTALAVLQQSPAIYFEPLKRLALHLAEQLVLAELRVDGQAIDRLVQSCIDVLSQQNESTILVELHPSDLAAWQDLRQRSGQNTGAGLHLEANHALPLGSVRASANDTLVEVLITERLAGLASALGLDAQRWRANSAFSPSRVVGESPPAAQLAQPHDASPDATADLAGASPSGLDDAAPAAIDPLALDLGHDV